VAGDHVAPGKHTLAEVTEEGFAPAEVVHEFPRSDDPASIVAYIGRSTSAMADVFFRLKPDLTVVFGDRYDLLIPVSASIPFRTPVAHIGGGESTEGAIDEQVRHAVTKAAHLHFVSTWHYGRRLRQMGEEAWRIHVVGSLGVENIRRGEMATPEELRTKHGIDPSLPTLLVTFHPETLTADRSVLLEQLRCLCDALREFRECQQVITYPGAEAGWEAILAAWREYVAGGPNAKLFVSLGSRAYLGLMRYAAAVVGNSSSGIVEAPSLKVPTVNIGDRQKGRIRAPSVIDVPCRREDIVAGIRKALYDSEFRRLLKDVENPYDPHGDGNVSGRIVEVLERVPLDRRLLEKRLDFPTAEEVAAFEARVHNR
jgi:UDP-hydrolysing UDP-N-acetyl-D-glucosamine 2-epimerase